MSAPPPVPALVRAAAAYYRSSGHFAWRFARGKLGGDPAFAALLEHGLLAHASDVLDLGAGQGLLAAWLLAAHAHYTEVPNGWPPGWPVPPLLKSYTGVEINAAEVRRARRAFGFDAQARVQIVHGDIRDVDYGTADAVVILDVLHYIGFEAQERVLARARAALSQKGTLLMRIGDADGGLGFTLSKGWDRAVALARRGRVLPLNCRPLAEWRALLQRLGFRVRDWPMSAGTPFSNVLLAAQPA